MFVVRIIRDEERTDFKTFMRREDAIARYNIAAGLVLTEDLQDAALFEVASTDDARLAVDLVKAADPKLVTLLKIAETRSKTIARLFGEMDGDA